MSENMDSSAFAFTVPPRTGGADVRKEKFEAPYRAVEHQVAGTFMTTIENADAVPSGRHVLIFHGGGYVMEAIFLHADVMRTLADMGHRVSILDYPLAPEHQFREIQDAAYAAYKLLEEKYPEDKLVIYGDSSGGGLGLELLMRLRDNGEKLPWKSVWASPAVDISMENPDIQKYVPIDKTLDYNFCLAGGKSYAGDVPTTDPRISPLYGNLDNLGEMLCFFGENELLRPDCELFIRKIEAAKGSSVKWAMGAERGHDYLMMVSYPASQEAFAMIKEFLK